MYGPMLPIHCAFRAAVLAEIRESLAGRLNAFIRSGIRYGYEALEIGCGYRLHVVMINLENNIISVVSYGDMESYDLCDPDSVDSAIMYVVERFREYEAIGDVLV